MFLAEICRTLQGEYRQMVFETFIVCLCICKQILYIESFIMIFRRSSSTLMYELSHGRTCDIHFHLSRVPSHFNVSKRSQAWSKIDCGKPSRKAKGAASWPLPQYNSCNSLSSIINPLPQYYFSSITWRVNRLDRSHNGFKRFPPASPNVFALVLIVIVFHILFFHFPVLFTEGRQRVQTRNLITRKCF